MTLDWAAHFLNKYLKRKIKTLTYPLVCSPPHLHLSSPASLTGTSHRSLTPALVNILLLLILQSSALLHLLCHCLLPSFPPLHTSLLSCATASPPLPLLPPLLLCYSLSSSTTSFPPLLHHSLSSFAAAASSLFFQFRLIFRPFFFRKLYRVLVHCTWGT